MRKALAVVRATALEVLSEPLSLLVLLAALALAVLAPAFHYHQFGEPTRMARDAGLSAVLTCGSIVAVFGTIRAFRREIESGTLEMALSHPVSRTGFFLSKTAGCAVASLVFALVVLLTSLVIVDGAATGGELAASTGDVARLWGPCLAAGVGVMVLPLVVAAALNRFWHFRFVLSAFSVAAVLAVAAAVATVVRRGDLALRLAPVAVAVLLPPGLLLTAAAAFAVRLKANAAAACTGVVFALFVPAVGNYYLSDALAKGHVVPWGYVGLAAMAVVPAAALFLLLGVQFIGGRDIS